MKSERNEISYANYIGNYMRDLDLYCSLFGVYKRISGW